MSVIGLIGQFMIDYQEIIGAVLLIVLAAILLTLLIKLIIKNSRRKKSEIEDKEKLMEELLKVSQDNKELLAELTRIKNTEDISKTDCQETANDAVMQDNKVEATKEEAETKDAIATRETREPKETKDGSLDEELIKELEIAAGGTVEEIVAKAIPMAREADEVSKIAAMTPAPAPFIETQESGIETVQEYSGEVIEYSGAETVKEHVVETAQEQPARIYTSRDASVDKHGNAYTEDMLKNQIG